MSGLVRIWNGIHQMYVKFIYVRRSHECLCENVEQPRTLHVNIPTHVLTFKVEYVERNPCVMTHV